MRTSEYPVWLAVMANDREAAKKAAGLLESGQQALGYDREAKLWYARPGADLDRLNEWMPDPSRRVGGGDVEAQFLDALTQAGLIIQGMPVMDGNAHRVMTVEDKKGGKRSGVYRGFDDRRPGGWFINYHRASGPKDGTDWKATVGGESDPVTSLHIRAGARQAQEDTARTRAELHAAKTLEAKGLYESFPAADPEHPYAVRKGITLTPDIRQTRNGALVVPFFNASGDFKTLQYIPPTGDKLLFKDAPKQGNFLVVGGELQRGQPVLYAEGYATARSLNMALALPVVMTIDSGNMVEVAKALKDKYPDSKHLFMADFDHAKAENKGLIMANQAAELVGGHVIYPLFTDEEKALGYTDFNDLHKSQGLTAVSDQVGPVLLLSLMGQMPSNKEMHDPINPAFTDKQVMVDSAENSPKAQTQTSDDAPGVNSSEPGPANKEIHMQDNVAAPPVAPDTQNQAKGLAGISYSELVVIHATPRKPTLNENGSVDINSAFHNAGGFDQKPDASQVEGRKPQGITTRASVHFTLQDPVSDHAYGQFEGREFTVYAPLKGAIEANGAPESLLASDTAFFAPDKAVNLPGAVVVQLDLAGTLPSNEFAREVDGGWLVAPALTDANRAQAENLLTRAELNNPGLGAVETLTYVRSAENGNAVAAEISKTLALNSLNAPTVNKALDIKHGTPTGFDGWASFAALEEFRMALPVSLDDKSAIVVGRHDATDGDRLNTFFRIAHRDGLVDTTQSRNTAIGDFAGLLLKSDLYATMRRNEIVAELASEGYTVRDDHGASSRGMAASIFDKQDASYQSPKLGPVSKEEVLSAVAAASPDQMQAIHDNLLRRGLNTQDVHKGDAQLSKLLNVEPVSSVLAPPPLPNSAQASPSLGSDVAPPFPAAVTPADLPSQSNADQGVSKALEPLNFTQNGQPVALQLDPLHKQSDEAAPAVSVPGTPEPTAAVTGVPPMPESASALQVEAPLQDTKIQPAIGDAELNPDERNQLRGQGWTDEQLRDIPADQARSVLTADTVVQEPVAEKAAPAADLMEQDEPASPAGPTVPSAEAKIEDDARPLDEPVIPAQPAQAGSEKSAEDKPAEPDVIWVGAPRGEAQAEQSRLNNVDLDALRTRITNEVQADKSVLYKLDGEPAFIDRGMRLEMADGGSQNDEKILAALVTAAEFYRGRIELTGSDAFKEKAIALIAQHEINVAMKVPDQQAMLIKARQALNTPAVAPDAVTGDSPPPYGPSTQAPAQPEQASTATGPVMDAPAAGKPESASAAPVAAADLSVSAPPRTVSAVPVAQADLELIVPVVVKADSTVQPPVAPQPVAQGGEANGVAVERRKGVPPDIHQSTQAAKNGVRGKVMDFGEAPFQFKNGNSESTFIMLRTKTGTQTFWGKELAGVVRDTRIEQGSMVKLQWLGQKPVTIQVPVKDEHGATVRHDPKETHRNQWSMQLLSNPAVRSGDDQGIKLMAYDANRFAQVQQALLSSLKLDVPLTLPRDGLFWMSPNGEGSSKTGDALTAPRPNVDSTAAGFPVMSRWAENGDMEAILVRGDGPFLQGVVRQNDEYRNVLVSLPGNEGAPPMVFNAITEHGLVPIGSGNGINRSDGKSVSRENIAFRLDGDAGTRMGKLDFPAELPPNLHSRLGFDERYQVDSQLPKSGPVAAPSVHPNDPRPS